MSERPEKVALVTGAANGIGRSAARAFTRAGYATVLADLDEVAGETVAAELQAEGATCLFVRCDVADEGDVRTLVERTVAAFGRLDAAFNNAGIEGAQADTVACAPENFDRVIAVNLRGVWLCMRHEIRQMLSQEGDGAIVNCASVAGLIGLPDIPAYVASKHGVIGLTRAAAVEYARVGIRVNAVCPGAIETPMLQRHMQNSDEARQAMAEGAPIGRIGLPEEIASAVLWLCEPGASFTTGQALAVDGGWTTR